jgi:3,4-dihydroxy 2-butanone 4-phosphate synthase
MTESKTHAKEKIRRNWTIGSHLLSGWEQRCLRRPAWATHDLRYDEQSSFSSLVNHRDTYTGITDEDRATTIIALAEAAPTPTETDFPEVFRAPGHVHPLRAASGLLADWRSHTELGIVLAAAADLPPAVVVCEMLDDDGNARSPVAARSCAARHDVPYVEGAGLVERFGGVR